MEFGFDAKTEDYRKRLQSFMDEHVYPAEALLTEHDGWEPPPVVPSRHGRPGRTRPDRRARP